MNAFRPEIPPMDEHCIGGHETEVDPAMRRSSVDLSRPSKERAPLCLDNRTKFAYASGGPNMVLIPR